MNVAANYYVAFAQRACELRRKLASRALLAFALTLVVSASGLAAQASDQPEPATAEHAEADEHAADAEHGGLSGLIWPIANFLVLAGGLYYFLRAPLSGYLTGRSSQIRKDLVDAAELSKTATAQLAEVERKMQALPGELEALRTRGAQEIVAEEERIASAAAADRARLLTQTRREIDARLQAAQRELSDHAATLALQLAEQKLVKDMTAADHDRLVARYVDQVKER